MIYEYPDEFVVPVIYARNFKEKSMNRDCELEYLKVETMIPFKENTQFNVLNNGMCFSDFDKCHNYMGDDNEGKYIKDILNDIDEEYVNGETLRI